MTEPTTQQLEAEKQLRLAAREGNFDGVQHALSLGARVDATDENGLNAMYYFATYNDQFRQSENIVDYKVLAAIKAKSEPTVQETQLLTAHANHVVRTPLEWAKFERRTIQSQLTRNRLKTLSLLMEQQPDHSVRGPDGRTVLMELASRGDTAVLGGYIAAVAQKIIGEINAGFVRTQFEEPTPIYNRVAIEQLYEDEIDRRLSEFVSETDHNGYDAMHYASNNGKLANVKYLHEFGMDITRKSKFGEPPILVGRRFPKVVNYLVKNGAPIQDVTMFSPAEPLTGYLERDEKGRTPLMRLVIGTHDDFEVQSYLEAWKKDMLAEVEQVLTAHQEKLGEKLEKVYLDYLRLEETDRRTCELLKAVDHDGCDVLHHAAAQGRKVTLRHLHSLHKDINCKTNNGMTPVFFAALSLRPSVVQTALDLGADKRHVNALGEGVMHFMGAHGTPEMIAYLDRQGFPYDILDQNNISPINRAILAKKPENVRAFMKIGAEILSTKEGHKAAAELARETGQEELAQEIEQEIARRQAELAQLRAKVWEAAKQGDLETFNDVMAIKRPNLIVNPAALVKQGDEKTRSLFSWIGEWAAAAPAPKKELFTAEQQAQFQALRAKYGQENEVIQDRVLPVYESEIALEEERQDPYEAIFDRILTHGINIHKFDAQGCNALHHTVRYQSSKWAARYMDAGISEDAHPPGYPSARDLLEEKLMEEKDQVASHDVFVATPLQSLAVTFNTRSMHKLVTQQPVFAPKNDSTSYQKRQKLRLSIFSQSEGKEATLEDIQKGAERLGLDVLDLLKPTDEALRAAVGAGNTEAADVIRMALREQEEQAVRNRLMDEEGLIQVQPASIPKRVQREGEGPMKRPKQILREEAFSQASETEAGQVIIEPVLKARRMQVDLMDALIPDQDMLAAATKFGNEQAASLIEGIIKQQAAEAKQQELFDADGMFRHPASDPNQLIDRDYVLHPPKKEMPPQLDERGLLKIPERKSSVPIARRTPPEEFAEKILARAAARSSQIGS